MKELLQKLRDFFSSPSHSRTLALMGILLLIGAIGLTATIVQQQTNIRQHAMVPVDVGGGPTTCAGSGGFCAPLLPAPNPNGIEQCPVGYTFASSVFECQQTGCCVPNTAPPPLSGTGICSSHAGWSGTSYSQCGQPFHQSNETGDPNNSCPYVPFAQDSFTIYRCNDGKYVCQNLGQIAGQCVPTVTPAPPTPASPPSNACSNPYHFTQGWGQGTCTSLSSICVVHGYNPPPNFVDGNAGCIPNIQNSQSMAFPGFNPIGGECWNYKNPTGGTNNLWNHTAIATQGSCTAPNSICWTGNIQGANPQGSYTKSNTACLNGATPGGGECWDYNGTTNLCLGQTNTPGLTCASIGKCATDLSVDISQCPVGYNLASGSYNDCTTTSHLCCTPNPPPAPAAQATPVSTAPSAPNTPVSQPLPLAQPNTPVPTAPPTPTAGPPPQPYLNLAINLAGIGTDTAHGNNNAPQHTTRIAHVQVYNVSDDPTKASPVEDTNITLTYNNGDGSFENAKAGLGKGITAGQYQIFIKTSQTLRKKIGTGISLANDSTTQISPSITLLSGDFVADNVLNPATDYNAGITSCYGSLATTSTCAIGLQQADLNDDGVIDGIDFNIFIRTLNTLAPNASGVTIPGDGAAGN